MFVRAVLTAALLLSVGIERRISLHLRGRTIMRKNMTRDEVCGSSLFFVLNHSQVHRGKEKQGALQ